MGDADAESAPFAWKAYLDGLSDRIAVSSVTGRCAALETELLPLIAERPLEDKELVALLATLKRTIGIYVDRASRAAVLAVLRKLAAAKPQVFVKAVAAVLDPVVESLQPKKTAHPDAIPTPLATRFVLLPWITTALPVPVSLAGAKPEDLPNDAAWRRLVTLAARLLWGIAPAHPGAGDTKASSMSRSAHCEVWRMLRGAPVLIAPMLAVLTAETGEAAAVLLGNVVSTASRIASDDARQAVAAARGSVVGFIERELVCAKMPVSYSSVADMRDFLRCHVGNDFDALFRPSISKMLVRAPECVLPTCLWLLQALGPDGADLTALYLEVLADPLASNMLRSTNDSVRSAAVELLAYLSGVPATEEAAVAAASILIKPMELGRYTQPEQRVAAYKLLGGVRAGPENGWASSVAILPALVRMAARETQEEPVRALFAAIGAHLRVIVDHLDAAVDPASSAYTQCEAAVRAFAQAATAGLALPDRSAVVRQAWAAGALGEPLWSRAAEGCKTGPWMSTHILPLLRRLVAAAEKAAADPLAAAGGLLDAHVGLALALRLGPDLDPSEIDAARLLSLAAGREKSLVLWDKVYHKCTRPSESVWALRCVQVLFAGGCDDTRLGGLLTWTLCHPAGPALESARATLDVISAMSRTDPIRLWGVLGQSLVESMTASLGTRGPVCGWPAVVSAAAAGILPGSTAASAEAASKLLVAMALACHHPAVVGAFGCGSLWVSLAQRTGIDPAELCHGHLRTLKQTVREAMLGEFGSATFEAAAGLAQGLVLIGGSAVARQLLEFAREDIDPAALAGITDEDVAVWRAPADQLYFDPLAAKEKEKGARGSTKNKADAWAEQLQEEVARK
ncbi:translational activator of GCN4, partial [Coemansia biformis]